MGDRDLVKALLGELAEVHFQRVFMKPGKPLNFATLGDTLLFGLPGNPVSCLVGFHLFVRPALQRMQLADAETLPRLPVVLGHDVQPSDRIEYQRATVTAEANGTLVATVTGSQQSARLMSFVGANSFLIVPPGDAPLPAGSRLDALLLTPPAARAAAE
jgi:molybdopterin biosynthesis enzyme